tara:strand:- start:60806 stop:61090 length:285 start_codon:yes stop_codon:yes gene_type:complete
MLLSKNIYKKTYCFFSARQQEKTVLMLEQKFYESIKLLKQDKLPIWHKRNKILNLLGEIDNDIERLYFDPEYKTYLESLRALTLSYLKSLTKKQ